MLILILEIPFSFFAIAIIDVANSGMLVPIATTETEIAASLILICCAKFTAPFTKNSAPKNNDKDEISSQIIIFIIEEEANLSSIFSEIISSFALLRK